MRVRHVLAGEHGRLRKLRLAALASSPEAFGSTHAGSLAHPPDLWERGAAESERGTRERTFVLVDRKDHWLGMAFTRLDAERRHLAWLGGMWIAPEARGRGGAGLLCQACIDWAGERKARELTLTVVVGNDVAKRAYEAAGFAVRERLLSDYGGRTLDEFVMTRSL
jgi:RimJ/RimL family protein N-acetyltransferase